MDEASIPKIISVDDHVVEPPHVWSTWLPAKYREHGPRVERRGIRAIEFAGAAAYREQFDDDSPTKVDTWVFESIVYTHKRHVAAVGYPRAEMTMTPITYDDMLPDLPALLRPDVRRGVRQGTGHGVCRCLQRLDR
jgi:hypothetical protein